MDLDLNLRERFEQTVEEVWEAITDPRMLARWLMENDFKPRVGHSFTLRRNSPTWSGEIRCQVLELDPPRRMVWSWSMGDEPDKRPSQVVFELERNGQGTVLTLRHTGPAADATGRLVTERWPIKVTDLRALLVAGRG
jgi:uncharacterized protein YndB with AHSA1/START domain